MRTKLVLYYYPTDTVMLFGGLRNITSCYSLSVSSRQWTKLKDIPSKRWNHGSAVIGNSVFLVGGYKNSTIDEFNNVTKVFIHNSSKKRSSFSSAISRYAFGIGVYKEDSL